MGWTLSRCMLSLELLSAIPSDYVQNIDTDRRKNGHMHTNIRAHMDAHKNSERMAMHEYQPLCQAQTYSLTCTLIPHRSLWSTTAVISVACRSNISKRAVALSVSAVCWCMSPNGCKYAPFVCHVLTRICTCSCSRALYKCDTFAPELDDGDWRKCKARFYTVSSRESKKFLQADRPCCLSKYSVCLIRCMIFVRRFPYSLLSLISMNQIDMQMWYGYSLSQSVTCRSHIRILSYNSNAKLKRSQH